MPVLYQTQVTATGGRKGKVASDDGLLALDLAMPRELGGAGGASNPEQLFAAGYAACFGSALVHVAAGMGHRLRDDQVRVAATVTLSQTEGGGFMLGVGLEVSLDGVPRDVAQELAGIAHRTCPYSQATRGNIDVTVNVASD